MTLEEYECQLNTAMGCVEAFKDVLDAVAEVDDVVGQPNEPCPVASQAAVKRIRRIVQSHEAEICGERSEPVQPPAPAAEPNNQQIHHTSYYQLPCGLYLEDYIDYKELDFKWGSAVKYEYRAGAKDGEPEDKDHGKRNHYICEIANREKLAYDAVLQHVKWHVDEARSWNPTPEVRAKYAPYPTDWSPSGE